ncbi:hypothetical protein BUALT_Bualt12G0126500 [Buddleja alternifolia]|uniref:CCHC-type domain-containing protein n=1 Tax=Buddleja alternifolia TaxID=168488 RepID=A0AAV6WVP6_9LAMI|nr:hypothetical protein BUALT_Bualt12G0126500 [Buddleja alternifolia]
MPVGVNTSTKGPKPPKCYFCKEKGHIQKACPKFKAWLAKKGNLFAFVCYESFITEVPLNTWWVDTGSTVHITNSLQGYRFLRKLNKGDQNISIGNGIKIPVEAVGTFCLVLESGFNLDLVDTIYVPSMTRNLISVSQLDAYGFSFKFENKGFSLSLNSKIVGSGFLEGNLYKLPLDASFVNSLETMNVTDSVVTKAKVYNPNIRKLDPKTISCHFIGYPERSKGYRFYCPSHSTRIVETKYAIFFEDAEICGSSVPHNNNLEENREITKIP